ncbi:hypothetical protein HGT73_14485 [Rosenbergiella australiborealis]|uniref:Uncharacterized protein n=1 Tax=Rosenbergiella australiborealis TaxID=1544696 RepID=A0ABS5T856_9GAMM|nr:hypothetical protein [Rosenbergiella australiborealis]MBT0728544.1 hypothetical protein [Rosenbergiella australiborealis]
MNQNSFYNDSIFAIFKEANYAQLDINSFKELGFDIDSEEFKFQMKSLTDNGLIQRSDGERGVGLCYSKADDSYGASYWIPSIKLQLSLRGRHVFSATGF